MPGQPELLHLPAELLQQIVKYLDPEDHSVLRRTCWTTRVFVLPYVFRTVNLNFLLDDCVQRQFQCLAAENGISRTAVKAYTRELCVIAPCWPAGRPYSLFSPEKALSAFQGIESVKIINYDVRSSAYDTIVPVLEYLASLKTLRSVKIVLRKILRGSSSRHIYSCQPDLTITTDSRIENPFIGLLGGPSAITRLTLDGRAFDRRCLPQLGWFFRNVIPLKLHALDLHGWDFDAAGIESLLPHLTHLRELRIEVHLRNTEILWPALETAKIKLEVLHANRQTSPQLLQYLSSFSGLQKLTMSRGFDCQDCSSTDIAVAIRTHARSLRELQVMDRTHDQWLYGDEIADALRQCIMLQTLTVAVTDDREMELFRLASSLPNLKSLNFEPLTPKKSALNKHNQRCLFTRNYFAS
ncbi:hypothetical protein BZA77DRAFT_375196 [Pyronema omphalodes]|nr:hypothetical protein BZA77DRAFT_375196 [Pyronema omphalodes]